MTDHERFQRLLAVPYGHSPEQSAALETHLQSCPACRATQTAYRRQDTLIRDLPAASPLPGFRRGVRERIEARPRYRFGAWRPNFGGLLHETIAGAAVALIIAGLVLFHLHSSATTGQKPTVAGNPSGGTTLCVPAGQRLTTNEMRQIRSIVAHRLHDGLGIKAPVRITGGSCVLLVGVNLHNAQQEHLLTAHGSLMVASYSPITIVLAPGSPVRRAGRLSCVLYPPGQSHPATNNCRAHLSVVVPDSGFRRGSATTTPLSGSDSTGVAFRFTSPGSRAWCHYTTRHVGKYAAFVLDNQVLTDPMIQSPICSGQGELIANTKLKARMLAAYINDGPLPAPITSIRAYVHPLPVGAGIPGSIPPAARQLADRLGIHEPAIAGSQAGGSGGPWTVWVPRSLKVHGTRLYPKGHSYLGAEGAALFTGPRGAQGEFHFFDLGSLSPVGRDDYSGPPMKRSRAVAVALAWLHRAGVSIPSGARHVILGGHTTLIGGSGMCCYKSLATVYWGKRAVGEFATGAQHVIYVADQGVVVQADIGKAAATGAESQAYPCKDTYHDANGVALGQWCFGYSGAARGVIFTQIGGHDGLITLPEYAAERVASRFDASRHTSPRQTKLTARRAVYRWAAGKSTYVITVAPAFPGLAGSTWYVQGVRAQGAS